MQMTSLIKLGDQHSLGRAMTAEAQAHRAKHAPHVSLDFDRGRISCYQR
jgi:hypothetical protein